MDDSQRIRCPMPNASSSLCCRSLARTVAIMILVLTCSGAFAETPRFLAGARQFAERAAAAGTDLATRTAKRVEHLVHDVDLLRKFHDAGEHGEEAVLAILRKAGIGAANAGGSGKSNDASDPEGQASGGAGPAASRAPQRVPDDGTLAAGPDDIRWPVDAGVISSEFGARWGRRHHGIDIAGRIGEPILAAADGEVIHAGGGLSGYGQTVILRHAGQVTTLYAHNSQVKVRVGDRVKRGALIALLGNTGRSTGPHVHFEVRRDSVALDPRDVLPSSAQLSSGLSTRVASR